METDFPQRRTGGQTFVLKEGSWVPIRETCQHCKMKPGSVPLRIHELECSYRPIDY